MDLNPKGTNSVLGRLARFSQERQMPSSTICRYYPQGSRSLSIDNSDEMPTLKDHD